MKNILLFISFIISITSVSALVNFSITYVNFNGNFSNGTTLFSDFYYLNNASITGYDVYQFPVDAGQNSQACIINYQSKNKTVCETQIMGYKNRTKTTCSVLNRQRSCVKITYLIPIKKRICTNNETIINQTQCNNIVPHCLNPNGEFTNQLRLENFAYSLDNGTNWSSLLYEPSIENNFTKLNFINQTILFKIDIPALCIPDYNLSAAIKISEYLS